MLDLSGFPRVALAHRPTPLERLPRLSEFLGGPELWIKRDDCTGLALGGNKTRKLEFLLGEALARKASAVVTFGALQSNHVRQTAAAAARLGLPCEAILEDTVSYREPAYDVSGNLLLDGLLGARIHQVRNEEAARERLAAIEQDYARRGQAVYVIPTGGSNAVGALGYVDCADETGRQLRDLGVTCSAMVHATASGGTQAGLLTGLHGLGSDMELVSIHVGSRTAAALRADIRGKVDDLCALLALDRIPDERIQAVDGYVGEGYGVPTAGMVEAVRLLASLEGILLDPVYTGKAMAGLIDLVRRGRFPRGQQVLFVHTGGTPGLFAYREALASD